MTQPSPQSQKSKELETDFLTIKGNIIECENTIIQTSNISTLETFKTRTKPFPTWTIIAGLFAFFIFLVSIPFAPYSFIASIPFAVCILIIVAIRISDWNSKNEKLKTQRYLAITLNNSNMVWILFTDLDFLQRVLDCIKEILANPESKKEYHINIKGNTINGGSVINDMYV